MTALASALSSVDCQKEEEESWELVESFRHLEVRSKYFKDAASESDLCRYDDGTVGGALPVLETNEPLAVAPDPASIPHPPQAPQAPPAIKATKATNREHAPPKVFTHIVFDTETTGLHEPHVVQLAYIIFTSMGTEIKRYNQLLRLLPGKRIDPRATEVHKITMNQVNQQGKPALKELEDFVRKCAEIVGNGGRVIAHNSQFDVRAINTTMSAWSPDPPLMDVESTFCTMKQSKIYSPLVDKAGRRKAFKNDEFFKHLFGREPDLGPLHDALTDILVTKANYLEGVVRMLW